jgi:serine/threonine protein kinase
MMASVSPGPFLPEYGSQVGPWLLRERIGEGSHGRVFRAAPVDRPGDNRYALKLALQPGDERFEREAHLLSRVKHPSVPRFESSGTWISPRGEAHPYVVMQWVEGMSLYARALEKDFTLRKGIGYLAQVARALAATHRYGGVHRDVKGGNVRVSPGGHAVLLDFGSCWYPGASPLTGRAIPPATDLYRSPQMLFFEFALNLGASGSYETHPADDVYALGITAYRMIAGTYPPRDADKAVRLVAPKGLSDACPELSALILRMLSEDPEARGSSGEVADELERLSEHPRPSLDMPWESSPSLQSAEKPRRLTPFWYVMKEVAPRWVATGSFVVMLLLWVLPPSHVERRAVSFTEPEDEPKSEEKPDAGTAVGEEAVASVAPAETPPVSEGSITKQVPDQPLPRQKLPPCTHPAAVEIKGGCWRAPDKTERPPCDPGNYEHQGLCYAPMFSKGERPPTSEEPQ